MIAFWLAIGLVSVSTAGAVASPLVDTRPLQTGYDLAVPSTQERSKSQSSPVYDTQTEETVNGTVEDIKTGGPGRLGWLLRIHTLGLTHGGSNETRLLVRTDSELVDVYLGPTTFLRQKTLKIRQGESLELTGARVMFDGSRILVAREIRRAGTVLTLRDATGEPLWNVTQTSRKFWTKKKVLLAAIVIGKVVALATVLRH